MGPHNENCCERISNLDLILKIHYLFHSNNSLFKCISAGRQLQPSKINQGGIVP